MVLLAYSPQIMDLTFTSTSSAMHELGRGCSCCNENMSTHKPTVAEFNCCNVNPSAHAPTLALTP